jgi:hypothetical protein
MTRYHFIDQAYIYPLWSSRQGTRAKGRAKWADVMVVYLNLIHLYEVRTSKLASTLG